MQYDPYLGEDRTKNSTFEQLSGRILDHTDYEGQLQHRRVLPS